MTNRMLHHVPAGGGTTSTTQTTGMHRTATICQTTVGAKSIWMGEVRMEPGAISGAHHHGLNETAIYVVAGAPEFIYRGESGEVCIRTKPGDYVYVPPFLHHIESNVHSDVEAVAIIARSSQTAIVENVNAL
jgi:uncharacterized RmlC-like cupin family protein